MMRVNLRRIKAWLRLQLSKRPAPYSLCYRPVESLAVFQALRAQVEQQQLDHALGLTRTATGILVLR